MAHPQALTSEQAQELDGAEDMVYIALHPGIVSAIRTVMDEHHIELVPVPTSLRVAESPTFVVAPQYL